MMTRPCGHGVGAGCLQAHPGQELQSMKVRRERRTCCVVPVAMVLLLVLVLLAEGLAPCRAGLPRFHHSNRIRRDQQQSDRGAGVPATQLRLHGGMRGCLQATSADDGRVQLHPCHEDSANQWWTLQPQSDDLNAVVVRLEDSISCITAADRRRQDEASASRPLHLQPCTSSVAQRFNVFNAAFVERGNMAKGFVLQSVPFSHLCLDGNMRATFSTALRLAPCEDSAFQLFHGDMLALLAQPAEARPAKAASHSARQQQQQGKQQLDDRIDKIAEKLRKHVAQTHSTPAAKAGTTDPSTSPSSQTGGRRGRNSFAARSSSQHSPAANRKTTVTPSKKETVVKAFSKMEWEGRVAELSCCSIQRLRQPVMSLLLRPGYHVVLYGDWRCTVVIADLFGSSNNVTAFLPSSAQQVHCIQAMPVQPSVHSPTKDRPSSVMLFGQEGFQGQRISVPTVQAPNLYQSPLAPLFNFDEPAAGSEGQRLASSLRVPAGARVFLHFGNRQGDGRLFMRDTPAGLQHAYTHISATWMPWLQLRGAVLCPRPQYEGHCQYFTLGFHDVPQDGVASIYLARPGYRVKLLDANSRAIVSIEANVTETSRVFELEQRAPASFLVRYACKEDCSKHGRCVGPGTCRCHKGWTGDHCQLGPPDFTSTIICDSNTMVAGLPLHCVLRPRHEGLPTVARRSDVTVRPVPEMQQHISIALEPTHAPLEGNGSESGLGDAEVQSAIHFTVTCNRSTSQHTHLFSAAVSPPGAPATPPAPPPPGTGHNDAEDGDVDIDTQFVHTPRIFVAPRWRRGNVQVHCGHAVESLLHGSQRYACQLTACASPEESSGCGPDSKAHWQRKVCTFRERRDESDRTPAHQQRRARHSHSHSQPSSGGRENSACDADCAPTAVERIACRVERRGGGTRNDSFLNSTAGVRVQNARARAERAGDGGGRQEPTARSFGFMLDIVHHDGGGCGAGGDGGGDQDAMHAAACNGDLKLRCGYVSTNAATRARVSGSGTGQKGSSDCSGNGACAASQLMLEDVLLDISLESLVQERAAHALNARISQQLTKIHHYLRAYQFSSALALTRHLLRELQRSRLGSLVEDGNHDGKVPRAVSDAVGERAVAAVRQLRLTLELLQLQVLQLTGGFDDMLRAAKQLEETASNWAAFGERARQRLEGFLTTAREMKAMGVELNQHSGSNACKQPAMEHLNTILAIARGSPRYRRWRAECFILHGNASAALADVTSLGRLEPTEAYPLRLMGSVQWRLLGTTQTAAFFLRNCQRRASPGDGELHRCRREAEVMERVASLSTAMYRLKAARKWQQAISTINELLELDAQSDMALSALKELCELHFFVNEIDHALYSCTRALEDIRLQEDDQFVVHLLMYRAWSYLAKEVFSSALRDVKRARRIAPHDMRLMLLQRRIEAAVKEATTKDYYSILGVPKGATKGVVRKAYRRLVRVWHPDKNNHPDAEQKFLDIVEAYEVLMDDELRQAYDKGLDLTEYMERRKRTQQQRDAANSRGDNTDQDDAASFSGDQDAGDADETGENGGEEEGRSGTGRRQETRQRRAQHKQTHINLPKHCCITFVQDRPQGRHTG